MESARRACSFFLTRLRAEVERLRSLDFPGQHPGPHKWLKLVAGEIDTAEAYLQRSTDKGLARSAALMHIADAEDLGNEAYELLEHMAGADADHIPHQIVAPFQRWVDGLGIKNTIFFRAEHAANYELANVELDIDTLNDPSASLTAAHQAMRWPVLRVTVPSQAMGMLPHFAVVAHELGHAIEHRIKVPSRRYTRQWAECEARIEKKLGPLGNDMRLAAQGILSNWVAELKSDAVGLLIAGPAFFFALCGFLELSGPGYGIGETHPPSVLRRRILFDRLGRGKPSFWDVLRHRAKLTIREEINSPHIQRLPSSDSLFRALQRTHSKESSAICVALVPFIENIAEDIFDSVERYLAREKSKPMVYTSDQLDVDLERHLEPLKLLIPPIEFQADGKMQATSLSSVLNVGWTALLVAERRRGKEMTSGFDTAKTEKLHELLLKAVELSEARQLWDDHQ